MKKMISLLVVVVIAISTMNAQSEAEKLKALLDGILDLSEATITENTTVPVISQLAAQQAETTIELTKENISEAFTTGMDYANALIIVGQHTIVKITNWSDCVASGAWDACMPKGEGLIRRGSYTERNDYINNIIGVPDAQTRTLYLFK
ncbi:hypothetical protein [Natronoflexus pectinivorans]|uniref:Allene oxide cyclase barrel-like domain-containing protein n=1 Tax=Natronoflexus pectinivorans TaxID=682526 RepID=A0A4R2GN65_9BACT|nr:hypothetical protein [Natronoflexus pectinivorans]TCO10734.1 hypothetical protein EV194_101366 [Natronoflexus pectinivorans]